MPAVATPAIPTDVPGVTLIGGLLSASFPLLRNLRCNPIRDMRDEN